MPVPGVIKYMMYPFRISLQLYKNSMILQPTVPGSQDLTGVPALSNVNRRNAAWRHHNMSCSYTSTTVGMEEPFQLSPRSPSLDLDVLDTIFAFLTDYSDLSSLSLTCSTLHPLAIRSLLRNRPVLLKNTDTTFKFHDFIFADPLSRLQQVTALKIDIAYNETHPPCSERAIESLLAILEHAPSLTSLYLVSDQKPGYLDDPRISATIGSLATLRELTVSGQMKADFIGAVCAPLTKLALRSIHPTDRSKWTPGSLSAALSRFAPSLESLSILNSHVRLAGTLPASRSPATHFHALRSLTLHRPECPPDLALLLSLFPNLDGTFHLTSFGYDDPDADPDDDDWHSSASPSIPPFLHAAREHNTLAQDTQRTWPRGLARLICDAETLFVLNLRGPVRLTVLPVCAADEDRAPFLAAALRAHPPARLSLQLVLGPVGVSGAEYEGLVPREAAVGLTHLTVGFKYEYTRCGDRGPVYPMPWGELWSYSILPALQHDLRALTHLRLVFHCEAWSPPEPAPAPASDTDPRRSHTILQGGLLAELRPAAFDFAKVAAALVHDLPALRYCFLTVGAWVGEGCPHVLVERWSASRAWRVVHDTGTGVDDAEQSDPSNSDGTCCGGRELVELHRDVAEAIIARGDLVVFMDEGNHHGHRDRSDPFGGMHG
ncbi:hypothetical protein GSI_05766 [Ganoderma sinense ZZ0214-1]|uniref:F-box domain-containing protein n=1 Tax=Ganoderma sinense ZZ0214-1 TaxID=1077348 RepID=A0A2G8SBD7_9APHY|nr:hypothetical protein GSI_05766 [Ganoderma sinense ZZ0214-1]